MPASLQSSARPGPQASSSGMGDSRQMPTAMRSSGAQPSGAPSAERDQSKERMRSAISPVPGKRRSSDAMASSPVADRAIEWSTRTV